MHTNARTIISIIGLIAILAGIETMFGFIPWSRRADIIQDQNSNAMKVQDAFALARDRAQAWHDDAVLSYSSTTAGQTGSNGQSDSWRLIFTSLQAKGKGLEVIIQDRMIIDEQEIPFFAKGAVVPESLISSQQAVDQVRALKGYEQEQIISVELLYDDQAKMWFWGVKTSRGIVSIKAQP